MQLGCLRGSGRLAAVEKKNASTNKMRTIFERTAIPSANAHANANAIFFCIFLLCSLRHFRTERTAGDQPQREKGEGEGLASGCGLSHWSIFPGRGRGRIQGEEGKKMNHLLPLFALDSSASSHSKALLPTASLIFAAVIFSSTFRRARRPGARAEGFWSHSGSYSGSQ